MRQVTIVGRSGPRTVLVTSARLVTPCRYHTATACLASTALQVHVGSRDASPVPR